MNASISFKHVTKVGVASAFYSQNLTKHTAVLPFPLLPIDNHTNQVLVHFF